MDIIRSGSQPSIKAPQDYFTGAVRLDQPFKGTGDARVSGALVIPVSGFRVKTIIRR